MVGGWVIREDNLVAEQSPVVGVEKQELQLLKAILGSQCAKNIKASESISGTHKGVEETTALQHSVPHTPEKILQSDYHLVI